MLSQRQWLNSLDLRVGQAIQAVSVEVERRNRGLDSALELVGHAGQRHALARNCNYIII